MDWQKRLKYDPLTPLLECGDEAVRYFARRDLLGEDAGPVSALWSLKAPQSILKKQQLGGFWKYPGKGEEGYLLATFQNLQELVYKWGFDRSHLAVEKACDYLWSCQTEEGDIRGFIGNQLAPYYTGIVLALLIRAGYADDPRTEAGLQWLLSMRQNDGGWVIGSPGFLGIPNLKWSDAVYLTSDPRAETLRAFDKSQPFSHSGTGMVIRAFAAHPRYCRSAEALQAARLLKSHFFKEDNYSSYRAADHWVRFDYPFWWNHLLAALDSLSLMGFPVEDEDVRAGLEWLAENQTGDGLWEVSYSGIHKASVNSKTEGTRRWVSLAVCRVMRRVYSLPSLRTP